MKTPFLAVVKSIPFIADVQVAVEFVQAVRGAEKHPRRVRIIGERFEAQFNADIALERIFEVHMRRIAKTPRIAEVAVKRRIEFIEVNLRHAQINMF